jgi:hypothetical protein
MTRTRSRLLVPLCAALALAGCSGDSEPTAGDPAPSPAASSSPAAPSSTPAAESTAPSPTVTESADPSEPAESAPASASATPTPTPTPSGRPPRLNQAVLDAAALPGFRDGFTWQAGPVRTREPATLSGICHRFTLSSIGAEKVRHREFTAGDFGPEFASHTVAQFPDDVTARRAADVLDAWARDCDEPLNDYPRARVGRLDTVAVDADSGRVQLVMYGPVGDDMDASVFETSTVVRAGARVSIVRMLASGTEYDYPAGQEPGTLAAQRAAAALTTGS